MKAIGDTSRVKALLAQRGWTSMSAWAKAHGYVPVTVRVAVARWGSRSDKRPHGGLSREIIKKLRAELARPAKTLTE